jgi:ATP-dependent exoDNAse (exonuclease V) beta subunit
VPLATATRHEPEAPSLPQTLPLLRGVGAAPVVADEATQEVALDPPRRVWRVVPERERPAAPAWVVGKIVHGALEQWSFFRDSGPVLHAWAAAEAQSCGITDQDETDNAVRRAEQILARFQATGLFADMDAAAQRLHEVPYSLADQEGRLENGVIDALYYDGAAWTLVEFKTDYVRDAEQLEKKLTEKDYVPQVARYLAAAERLLGVRPRPVLCLLNYAGAVRLVEDRW